MASRCRSCGVLSPRIRPFYPHPAHLSELAPFLALLLEAASEYDQIGEDMANEADMPIEFTSATEFCRWLQVDVERTNQRLFREMKQEHNQAAQRLRAVAQAS